MTSKDDSLPCREEPSDAQGYDALKDLFTTSNPEILMEDTSATQPASVDIVFNENSEGCGEPVLIDMPHTTEDLYSATHIGQLDATMNLKTQLRDACYSNDSFLDLVVGSDSFAGVAASPRSQSDTAQTRQMHTSLYGASPGPDIWKHTHLFRTISPTTQISNSLHQAFYNSLFLEHVDMLENFIQQKVSRIESPELDNRWVQIPCDRYASARLHPRFTELRLVRAVLDSAADSRLSSIGLLK